MLQCPVRLTVRIAGHICCMHIAYETLLPLWTIRGTASRKHAAMGAEAARLGGGSQARDAAGRAPLIRRPCQAVMALAVRGTRRRPATARCASCSRMRRGRTAEHGRYSRVPNKWCSLRLSARTRRSDDRFPHGACSGSSKEQSTSVGYLDSSMATSGGNDPRGGTSSSVQKSPACCGRRLQAL